MSRRFGLSIPPIYPWTINRPIPRTEEKTIPRTATPVTVRNPNWMPTSIPEVLSTAWAWAVVRMAPANPTPKDHAYVTGRGQYPEAMPRRSTGAAPNKALLLGEMNIPIPRPTMASPRITSKDGDWASSRERKTTPLPGSPFPGWPRAGYPTDPTGSHSKAQPLP